MLKPRPRTSLLKPFLRITLFVLITFACYSCYEYILNLLLGSDTYALPASKRIKSRESVMLDSAQRSTTSLPACEYKVRRWKLFKTLHGTFDENSLRGCNYYVVALTANSVKTKTNDIKYPYHQDTDILYLTGLDIPDAVAVLEYRIDKGETRTTKQKSYESIHASNIKFLLFFPQETHRDKIWESDRSKSLPSKADMIFPLKTLHTVFSKRYANKTVCLWRKATTKTLEEESLDIAEVLSSDITDNVENLQKSVTSENFNGEISNTENLNSRKMNPVRNNLNNIERENTRRIFNNSTRITMKEKVSGTLSNSSNFRLLEIGYNIQILRLVKSSDEIILIRESTKRTVSAFIEVMKTTRPGNFSYQTSAYLEYRCKSQGAEFTAFAPVVSSGTRPFAGVSLHSTVDKDYVFRNGDLVLLDAGCEYSGYASDVTRTWPISGKFTAPQRQLYEIVLSVQKKCIRSSRIGTTLEKLNTMMLISLAEGLQNIELIPKTFTEPEQLKTAATKFCPHYVGHYIGLDVHDTPLIHSELPLQPGMVITIEPGIYVPHSSDMPERYKGINIRIEDMLVITDGEPLVLTGDIPKEVKTLEGLRLQ